MINRWQSKRVKPVFILLALLTALLALTACGGKIDIPEDALSTTNTQLIGRREYVSYTETALTQTMTDAYRTVSEAQIGLIDAVSFPEKSEDADIAAGGITREMLEKLMPGERTIVTVYLSGRDILKLAENNVNCILRMKNDKEADSTYAHFSGAVFIFNKKADQSARIVEAKAESLPKDEEGTKDLIDLNTEDGKTQSFLVAMNSGMISSLAKTLGKQPEIVKTVGNEVDLVADYIKEHGITSMQSRFVDKADLDAPKIAVTVVIVVLALALAGIIIAYFVLKKKQKAAKAKRKGEPRIDV